LKIGFGLVSGHPSVEFAPILLPQPLREALFMSQPARDAAQRRGDKLAVAAGSARGIMIALSIRGTGRIPNIINCICPYARVRYFRGASSPGCHHFAVRGVRLP
jgi:hypothetical protein